MSFATNLRARYVIHSRTLSQLPPYRSLEKVVIVITGLRIITFIVFDIVRTNIVLYVFPSARYLSLL